uniref:HTH CENPB-type domain-containing protein n=1 Tax=Latimeria chalumnae TaxID=7897 RepID=H3A290_LATCH
RKFGVNECNIWLWRKQKEKLLAAPKGKKSMRSGIVKWPKLEDKLAEWVTNQRVNALVMSRLMIRMKAFELAKETNHFTGCESWLTWFTRRKGFTVQLKTRISQMPDEYEEKLCEFQRYVIKMGCETQYEIGSMDEVPICFNMPPPEVIKMVQMKTIRHKKSHFTVVLTCMADGTKLKPRITFKCKTLSKGTFLKAVIIAVHEKGWMNEHEAKDWIDRVWKAGPRGLYDKVLLVFDAFRGCLHTSIRERLKKVWIDIAVISGGLTSLLQPLDTTVNKSFKDKIHSLWSNWV